MREVVKAILLVGTMGLFTGCNAKKVTVAIDNFLARGNGTDAGNKRYQFTSPEAADEYLIETKHFTARPLLTKSDDWRDMGTWKFVYNHSRTTVMMNDLSFPKEGVFSGIMFHIGLNSWLIRKYNSNDKALEEGDEIYFQSRMPHSFDKKTKEEKNINVHIEYHGKENYPCVVYETKHGRQLSKEYVCYKFNQERTLSKRVRISLGYFSMTGIEKKYPHLAEKCSYEELQRRAKRTLDSLYIKDVWERY